MPVPTGAMALLAGVFALLFASIVLPSMIVQDLVALPGQRPSCGAVAAVPPDLVPVVAVLGQVIAHGQVLDRDSAGLRHHHPVTRREILLGAGRRAWVRGGPVAAVDDHPVAVQSADVQVRLLDPDARGR